MKPNWFPVNLVRRIPAWLFGWSRRGRRGSPMQETGQFQKLPRRSFTILMTMFTCRISTLQQFLNIWKCFLKRVVQEAERSEEHTSELQSRGHLVCRLLLEKKKEDSETLATWTIR